MFTTRILWSDVFRFSSSFWIWKTFVTMKYVCRCTLVFMSSTYMPYLVSLFVSIVVKHYFLLRATMITIPFH
jgi:hypothetical protein